MADVNVNLDDPQLSQCHSYIVNKKPDFNSVKCSD